MLIVCKTASVTKDISIKRLIKFKYETSFVSLTALFSTSFISRGLTIAKTDKLKVRKTEAIKSAL
jgi:hypothetical protein